MSFPVGQDIQSVNVVNINMPEGLKNITVQAINKLLLASDQVIYNFTAVHSKPTKKGMRLHLSKQYIKLHSIFFNFISTQTTNRYLFKRLNYDFRNKKIIPKIGENLC